MPNDPQIPNVIAFLDTNNIVNVIKFEFNENDGTFDVFNTVLSNEGEFSGSNINLESVNDVALLKINNEFILDENSAFADMNIIEISTLIDNEPLYKMMQDENIEDIVNLYQDILEKHMEEKYL